MSKPLSKLGVSAVTVSIEIADKSYGSGESDFMTFEIWLTLFLASIAISVSPGAGAVLSMNYGINYGLKKSYWAILGLQAGYLIQMIIVIIGLGSLIAKSMLKS